MVVTLEQIVAHTRKKVAEWKRATDHREMERLAETRVPKDFRGTLLRASARGPAIIAELKKASPSKGMIRGTLHVAALASGFEAAGAAALSVLTEEDYFQGSIANLYEASAATKLPCLRKDFIVDRIQIVEAKAAGADAVLLIVGALAAVEFTHLYGQTQELGLPALCEVHDEKELEMAAAVGANLIGVNSRDLHTFQVDLETAVRLAPKLPKGAVRVAESGINSGADIRRLRDAGYQAFLIGESLMKAESPEEALRRLIAEAKAPPLGSAGVATWGAGTKD
ncbi:MAG TPA: indole-3-glycerol phosphate synthase TrpC [Terriglobales bacterium]|nr:indole-3-glycerol phosphate synthase TrpC [Terriglobales bacterium]